MTYSQNFYAHYLIVLVKIQNDSGFNFFGVPRANVMWFILALIVLVMKLRYR